MNLCPKCGGTWRVAECKKVKDGCNCVGYRVECSECFYGTSVLDVEKMVMPWRGAKNPEEWTHA